MKVFISYRREDNAYVTGFLRAELEAYFGKGQILQDISSIPLGEEFQPEISRMIGESDVLLAVIGPRWEGEDPITKKRRIDEEGDLVRFEIAQALQRNIRIYPILLEGRPELIPITLPSDIQGLARIQHMILHSGLNFQADIKDIIQKIQSFKPSLYIINDTRNTNSPREVGISNVFLGLDNTTLINVIKSTRSRLWLLSNWFRQSVNLFESAFVEACRHTTPLDIRVLLPDPDSATLIQRSKDLKYEDGEGRRQVLSNLAIFEHIRQNQQIQNVALRTYTSLCSMTIVISDYRALVGFFCKGTEARDLPWLDIVIKRDEGQENTVWGETVENEFKATWKDATPYGGV